MPVLDDATIYLFSKFDPRHFFCSDRRQGDVVCVHSASVHSAASGQIVLGLPPSSNSMDDPSAQSMLHLARLSERFRWHRPDDLLDFPSQNACPRAFPSRYRTTHRDARSRSVRRTALQLFRHRQINHRFNDCGSPVTSPSQRYREPSKGDQASLDRP